MSPIELFKLLGTIAVKNDEANAAIDDTTGKAERSHSKIGSAFGKIGSAAAKVGKAVAAGMVAAGAAIVKIAKDAVASYADYEQLVGGIDTLFKKSSAKVQQYAQNAYKTAGLSANRYMETVTSFSAALLQSLGNDTNAAAEYADMAVKDMSDNANKMGTDMETIIATYQSLSRGNYAMLDNLKLGYGGTKEEMERLIADAAKLDKSVKANDMSFGNLTKAIHAVQNEMGITGTTAKEAATTIQGSASSMKAAWQNLLTGFADPNQNLDALFQQFIDSVVVFGENLIPRIQMLLPRIVTGISQLAQALAVQLPMIIETLLPALIQGAVGVVSALIMNLPQILQSLITAIVTVFQGFGSQLQQSGGQMLDNVVSGIQNGLPKILSKAVDIILNIINGILNNLPKIAAVAGEIIGSLVVGIVKFLPKLAAKVPTIIATIIKGVTSLLGSIISLGVSILKSLWQGISSWISSLLSKVLGFAKKIPEKIKSGVSSIFSIGSSLVKNLWNGISSWASNLISKVSGLVKRIPQTIKNGFSGIASIGTNLVKGLWNGIGNAKDWILGKIKGFGSAVMDGIKSFFGIHSPSKVMEEEVGAMLSEGIAAGITSRTVAAVDAAKKVSKAILGATQNSVDKLDFEKTISAGVKVNGIAGTASGYAVTQPTLINYSSYADSKIDMLILLLQRILHEIVENAGHDIYLDKDTLIGSLDDALEERRLMKERGI